MLKSYQSPQLLEFRKIVPSDIDLLHRTFWQHQPLSQIEAMLVRSIQQEQKQRGVALVGVMTTSLFSPQIVCFGQLMPWRDLAEISDIIVSEGWRSQGIGAHLLQHLLNAAKVTGYKVVEISVEESNAPALALYRRLGFTDYRMVTISVMNMHTRLMYLRKTITAADNF